MSDPGNPLFWKEKAFETLVEKAPDIISRFDRELRHVYVNRAVTLATGRPAEDFIGKTHEDLGMPSDLTDMWNEVRLRVMETGREETIEFSFPAPDGTVRWFRSEIVPEQNDAGEVETLIVVARDITSAKAAEEARIERERREVLAALNAELQRSNEKLAASEAALRRSEAFFRRLAEANLVGVGFGSGDGVTTYLNDEMLRLMGRTRAEFEAGGVNWLDCIAPEYRAEHESLGETLLRDGRIAGYERAFLHRDGTRTPFLGAAALVGDGSDVHVSIALDLTPLHEAHGAFVESEARLRLALEGATLGMWSADLASGEIDATAFNRSLFGFPDSAESIPSASWLEVVHPADRDRVREAWRAAAGGVAPYVVEYRIQPASGAQRWIASRGRVQLDANGAPSKLLGVSMDITDRKEVEHQLRLERERFRVALQNSPTMVCSTDASLRYTWAFNSFDGLTAEGLVGRSNEEIFAPEEARAFTEFQKAVLANNAPARAHLTLHGRTFDLSAEPLHDPTGLVAGVMVAATDVTELAHAKSAAEGASQARDTFLATVSHELRTPMTSVVGWITMLQQNLVDDELMPVAIESLAASARLQQQLVDDLIDVSRIATGKLALDLGPVLVEQLVRRVFDSARSRSVDVAVEIVEPPSPLLVVADARRLEQALSNLVTNALKFTPPGGRVTISSGSRDGSIYLRVADTGRGIAQEFLTQVFDRFAQEDAGSHRGLGLGLSIVQEIVTAHGGQVRVSSAGIGKGAEFEIELPDSLRSAK